MKNLFLILLLPLAFYSCKKSNETLLKEIETLTQSDEMGTPEGLNKLANLHEEYGLRNEDSLGNAYLYAAALHSYHSRDTAKAIELLDKYLERDDSSVLFRNVSLNLANLENGKQHYARATELVCKAMDKQMLDGRQWQDAAVIIQNKMDKDNAMIDDYIALSKVHMALGNLSASISTLDTAITNFPDYEKRPNLLLRAGFLAWEYLKKKELAEQYYNQFLEEYPNHSEASEVKTILSSGYLGMSNEEILKQLQLKKQ